MELPNWMRSLPHPNYGKWCGAKNTHDSQEGYDPIDDGDKACMIHDFKLRNAEGNQDKKHKADAVLWKSWKAFKPTTTYGKIYRCLIMVTFNNKYCKDEV